MEFLILVLATFGIAEAITGTDGPFDIFKKLRDMKYSYLFNCFTCFSFWAALTLAVSITPDFETWLLYGLGAAGGSIFLDYLVDRF